ncbi:MAG: glycosyltransferase [Desulfobacterium sp.]|nr:glycosyltransferase [Desulfobacteraceae bacterium]MBA3035536.1 glycosyltransferase [Desulfobacterium sp.]
MTELWVIAPVFNEEKSLESFVREWIPVIRTITGCPFTFCLLNDGSTDGSLHILKALANEFQEIRIMDSSNKGHGPTCLSGYKKAMEANAEWIFQIDSDGQCDPAHFEAFWKARKNGLVHYGCRYRREDGWHRRWISKALSILLFLLSFRWVRDANVPYRLMHRDALCPALKRIPAGFRAVHVLLSRIHDENPGINCQNIRFRKRTGRQLPTRPLFFLREAAIFVRDYVSWAIHDGNPGKTGKAIRVGKVLLSLFAAYYMIVFFILALLRIPAFVEYDWIEGMQVLQVHRLLHGMPLYPAPSSEYVPLLYGPLYTYLGAAVSSITGESYTSIRMISLVSTLGTLILIGMLVMKMTGSRLGALVAAGLYAGTYRITGFSFDLARVDSLFIFFTMATAYCLYSISERNLMASIGAILAATCAVLSKQTALVPVFALCIWSITTHKGQTRLTAMLCMGSILTSQILLNIMTNGWFFYYTFKVPSAHPILLENILLFLRNELPRYLCVGFALSFLCLHRLFRKPGSKPAAVFFFFFFVAMVISGLAPRFKIGGAANNLMPIGAALAVGCGLLLGDLHKMRGKLALTVLLLLLYFNYQILYRPTGGLPKDSALDQTQVELRLLQTIQGPVLSTCQAFLPIAAKKNASVFWGSMIDVWLTPGKESERVRADFYRALQESRFKSIVLKDEFYLQDHFPFELLAKHYKKIELSEILPIEEARKTRLTLYVPRQDVF